MTAPFDVCIRGTGPVGRTLALLLARERLRVGLVGAPPRSAESQAAHGADLRAYALNQHARALLQALRCWPEATPVRAMEVYGDRGGAVHFNAAEQRCQALAWIVEADALQQQLAEALHYQPLVEQLAAPVPAVLTVICEGKASPTRAALGVEFEAVRYGQQAIAARIESEQPHGQIARQWFDGAGRILAFLPRDGAAGNSVAVIWSVPDMQVNDLLALDDGAFAAALYTASHGALGALRMQGTRVAWPLQYAHARRWCGADVQGQSWVLAGDAAHAMHPLAGQGLNLGLADAGELARVLCERAPWRSVGDVRTLRRYERARKAGLLAAGSATDGLQRLFTHPSPVCQTLRNWGMKNFDRSGPFKRWVARQATGN